MSIVFTVLKFVLYFVSGSIAVLSEAWHSCGDFATSLLVFFSFRKDRIDVASRENDSETESWMSTETRVALLIGCALVFIAGGILYKVITAKPTAIDKPTVSGICFILFSTGSYFLYRFSTSVGVAEKSAALISDGLHSKADMYNSLLTGFSLLLYTYGINVDRIVGGILAFFLLSYAVEMFANVYAMYLRKSSSYERVYSFSTILVRGFSKLSLGDAVRLIDSRTGWKIRESIWYRKVDRWKGVFLTGFFLVLYFSTSLVRIQVDEEGIIEHFGKPVLVENPLGPGLHLKYPWPVDRVIRLKTKQLRELRLGNISYESGYALIWTRQHGEEENFLSGDNNFFNPYLILHYRIKDPGRYVYGHSVPEVLLEDLAYRELNRIFITKEFEKISIYYRKQLEREFGEGLQNELDCFHSGIEIVNVVIKDIHPPISISGCFEDVIAAFQEKQRDMNLALSYRNSEIPVARGKAERSIQEGRAYVTDRTLRAEGEAKKFEMQLRAYRSAPDLTKKRMYLETVQQFMQRPRRIIVDPRTGVPDVWFNAPGIPGVMQQQNTKTGE